jgi:hypothetical protein
LPDDHETNPAAHRVREAVLGAVWGISVAALLGVRLSLSAYELEALISTFRGPRLAVVANDLEKPMSFQPLFPGGRSNADWRGGAPADARQPGGAQRCAGSIPRNRAIALA